MFTVNRGTPRRGVILLIVLSLLAMFGMVSIGFLVITSHNRRAAQTLQKVGQNSASPEDDLHRAAMQLIHGTLNLDSVAGPHSLLEDAYGPDTVPGTVTAFNPSGGISFEWLGSKPTLVAGRQITEFTIPRDTASDANVFRYSGRVITFTSGACEGVSSRIVGVRQAVNPSNGNPMFWLMPDGTPSADPVWKLQVATEGVFPMGPDQQPGLAGYNDDGAGNADDNPELSWPIGNNDDLQVDDQFIINGTPFSGTGFGFNPDPNLNAANPDTSWLNLQDTNPINFQQPGYITLPRIEFALRPNPTAPTAAVNLNTGDVQTLREYGQHMANVAANEDYDAVDYQNMVLSLTLPFDGSATGGTVPIPSFHRPALINYWFHRMVADNSLVTWQAAGWTGLAVDTTPADIMLAERWRAVLQPFGADCRPGLAGVDDDGDNIVDEIDETRWPNDYAGTPIAALQIINLKRKIILRPLPEDHPNFDGSNLSSLPANISGWDRERLATRYWQRNGSWDPRPPTLLNWDGNPGPDPNPDPTNPLYYSNLYPRFRTALEAWLPSDGQWDVDNDGDTRKDSIWVDLGMPVRELPDGRKYKPLYAILCADLDGRLNLNAHGNVQQVLGEYTDPQSNPDDGAQYAGGISPLLPRGQGYGPAEINLGPMFGGLPYDDLFYGRGLVDGRYGERVSSEAHRLRGIPYFGPSPGVSQMDLGLLAGLPFPDFLSQNKLSSFPQNNWNWSVFPQNYLTSLNGATRYGSPGDLHGTMTIGLDLRGQPVYRVLRSLPTGFAQGWNMAAWNAATSNVPYELDLSQTATYGESAPTAVDNPFGPAELERLLRPFDIDQNELADRLAVLTSTTGNAADSVLYDRRHEITTESWDLPTINVAHTRELRDAIINAGLPYQRPRHVSDLVDDRLRVMNIGVTYDATWRTAAIRRLLSPEVLAGQKMDLNRPLGDGRDNNGNNVVDEPEEALADVFQAVVDSLGNTVPRPFDHVNGQDVDGDLVFGSNGSSLPGDPVPDPAPVDKKLARQLYARQLYVLMMMLVPNDWYPPWEAGVYGYDRTNPTWQERARARALAQWAVNVVDFYDRDAIMTPFEYDIRPFTDDVGQPDVTDPSDLAYDPALSYTFGTWEVDGRLNDSQTNPSAYPTAPDALYTGSADDIQYDEFNQANPGGHRGLVWGCERPELLISETLAFHDTRRITGANELRYQPQGSLFIELFNPWTDDEPAPGELYDAGLNGVDLAKTPPGSTDAIWRMIIVGPAVTGTDPDDPHNIMPDSTADALGEVEMDKDPDHPDLLMRPYVDRSIYFVSSGAPALEQTTGTPYYVSQAITNGLILRNRYAVIGPSDNVTSRLPANVSGSPNGVSYVGFIPGSVSSTTGQFVGTNQTRRIDLLGTTGGAFDVYGNGANGDLAALNLPRPVVTIPIDMPRRLSASEPNTEFTAISPATGLVERNMFPNYDENTGFFNPVASASETRVDPDALLNNPEHDRFRVIHLQRLADPLRPHDPYNNPYRTIDTAQIDLVVFNGVDSGGSNPLITRERGESAAATVPANLWTTELPEDSALIDNNKWPHTVAASHFFDESFYHSLGFLNESFGLPVDETVTTGYGGDPQDQAFPWMTWNNRPFVSQLELLMVPAMRSSHLLRQFSMTPGMPDPFLRDVNLLDVDLQPDPTVNWNFNHLANFFATRALASTAGGPPPPPDEQSASLYRLLDYVHVPSRFVGTETQLHPQSAYDPGNAHDFHPPFNKISRYREPGKVNLNTVFSPLVWQGLMNYHPIQAVYQPFFRSRRGYEVPMWSPLPGGPGTFAQPTFLGNALTMHPGFPTRFANPFRSASGKNLVPLPYLMPPPDLLPQTAVVAAVTQWNYPDVVNPNSNVAFRTGDVSSTLLRQDPASMVAFPPPPTPPNAPTEIRMTRPLFSFDSGFNAPNDSDRNPYFRYQGLQRLGNITTTRSNVYAVWITVGYFEVEKVEPGSGQTVDRNVYQEGYTLGRELGGDTGEVKRHRAFYVIDRSIPVGFQRGRDLNVEKTIVLKRFIE